MTDIKSQAVELSQETLQRLVHRLDVIWRKWGAEDYPHDSGIEFRNELFLFGDWMLYLLRQGCAGGNDAPNEWMQRNALTLLKLDATEMVRCIGIARMHMTAFWWHMRLNNGNHSVPGDTHTKKALGMFGKQLDWIYTVHDLPDDTAKVVFRLLVDNLEDDGEFLDASKQNLGHYLVKTSLGWCEASSPEMWDHWATAADMSFRNQLSERPAETRETCERVFAEI